MKLHAPLWTSLWHHALYLAITMYLLGILVLAFQKSGVPFKHILKWPKFFFDIHRYEKFMLKGSPASMKQAYEARDVLLKMWPSEYGTVLVEKDEAGSYHVVVSVTGKPTEGLLTAAKSIPKIVKGVDVIMKPDSGVRTDHG